MKFKNFLILLFIFMMVFSYFATVSPYPAVQSSTNNFSKVQQNSCPILVKGGSAIVPIDFINITYVWNYTDYDPTLPWNQQTGYNYYTGYYDQSKGLIYNLTLPDNTQIVVAGYNTSNMVQIQQDFCPPNSCGFITVSNQQINGSFPFTGIYGVYLQTNFNYNASPIYNQGSTNYFTTSSSYVNGHISGINLADGTAVVVVGKDNQGNVFFMDSFCQGPNYGVKVGDSFTYNFTTNAQGQIPLFGLFNNTPIVANGDTFQVGISKITPDNVTLKFTFGSTISETNDTMFFVVPLNFIESLISGTFVPDPNNTGPTPNLLGYTNSTVKLGISDPNGNTTVILDRMHGNLVQLDGSFLDPQGNPIKMSIQLTSSPYGIPNPNLPPQDQSSNEKYHIFGITKGDSFIYNFTTDSPNKMPFFGLNGDNPIIQNGDSIKVDIVDILIGLNQPPLLLQYTIGSNAPFKTNESVFFIVPIDMLNAIVNGSYTPDSTSNEPKIQLGPYNDSVVVVNAVSPDFSATLQFDRQHGNLLALTGKITDPQNNVFNIGITLSSATFSTDSSSQQSSSSNNTLTTSPGFELMAFLPIVPIVFAIKKKRHN